VTKLAAKVTVGPKPSQWWGTFDVSDITTADGKPTVKDFLYLNFRSPARVAKNNVNVELSPWVAVNVGIINNQQPDGPYDVMIEIVPATLCTLDKGSEITIGVEGDLTVPDVKTKYLDTFVLYADEEPTGTVEVNVAKCPDLALADVPVKVCFTYNETCNEISRCATLGFEAMKDVKLLADSYPVTYSVSANPIANKDETVIAQVLPSSKSVTLTEGQTVPLPVGFGPVEEYGALDVTIHDDIPELVTEMHTVEIVKKDTGELLKSFRSKAGQTTPVRHLPRGTVEVRVHIALNNVMYKFPPKDVTLGSTIVKVIIDSKSVTHKPIDPKGFISQPIAVTTDATLSRTFLVRLISTDINAGINYAGHLPVNSGPVQFPYVLKPGSYTIEVSNFLDSCIVYTVKPTVTAFDASPITAVEIKITSGTHLLVPGFPEFLSFGACTDFGSTNADDFAAARASAIFTYAGQDGGGDPTKYLKYDKAKSVDESKTSQTIKLARDIENKVGGGHRVLPMMISYTCNLSGDNVKSILQDEEAHKHSYANYILALSIARDATDAKHPVPVAFIVNPDFLGACQKAKLLPTESMPVRKPLQDAIQYAVEQQWLPSLLDIPDYITENIKGYVRSVNWLTRAVAGTKVSLGWQSNLWGVPTTDGSKWIYPDDPGNKNLTDIADKTAQYVLDAGVFDENKGKDYDYGGADFHAIDRYERDDLTGDAYNNSYCYGPYEWPRYYDFCAAVSQHLNKPVMPWQIPASRLPSTTDTVSTPSFDNDHWGTGGSYLLGQPEIGGDINNINPTVKNFILPATFPAPYTSKPVSALFTRQPFDWSAPHYTDFPLRGIFSVLLGGGSTTGIVSDIGKTGPWTQAKISKYMDHPIPLCQDSSAVSNW
jgi:hypothetical protein